MRILEENAEGMAVDQDLVIEDADEFKPLPLKNHQHTSRSTDESRGSKGDSEKGRENKALSAADEL